MKKYFITLLLFCALIVTAGCTNNKIENKDDINDEVVEDVSTNNVNSIKEKIEENAYDKYDLLMTKAKNNTKLYGTNFENNMYTEMELSVNEKFANFVWSNIPNEQYMPQLEYCDLTGDGKDELIVFTTLSVKKDYLKEEAHVVNVEMMEEILFESAYEELTSRTHFNMLSDGVEILLDDNIIGKVENSYIETISAKEDWYEEAILSDGEHYEVNGGIFQGFVLLQISDYGTFGTFEVNYKYDEGKLVVDNIRYVGTYLAK